MFFAVRLDDYTYSQSTITSIKRGATEWGTPGRWPRILTFLAWLVGKFWEDNYRS